MPPLLLLHADVVAHLQSPLLRDDLRRAFATHARTPASGEAGRGWLAGVPASSERIPAGIPATGGREALLLRSEPDGALLAVLEAAHLTAITRAVVGALAAEALSRPEARHVALLGAGPHAARQLKALRLVRSLDTVRVWDEDLEQSQALAARLHAQTGIASAATVSVEEAVRRADLVICSGITHGRRLAAEQLAPGTLVNVTDAPTAALGPLGEAPWEGFEIVEEAPEHPGQRTLGGILAAGGRDFDPAARTVFLGPGQAFQDLVAAWLLYELVRDDPDAPRLPPGS